jgi:hypothetical protein
MRQRASIESRLAALEAQRDTVVGALFARFFARLDMLLTDEQRRQLAALPVDQVIPPAIWALAMRDPIAGPLARRVSWIEHVKEVYAIYGT